MSTQQELEAMFYAAYHESSGEYLRKFIATLPAENRHVQALQHFTRNNDYLENGFICGMIREAFRQYLADRANMHPATIHPE